jgi:hypothetical protein
MEGAGLFATRRVSFSALPLGSSNPVVVPCDQIWYRKYSLPRTDILGCAQGVGVPSDRGGVIRFFIFRGCQPFDYAVSRSSCVHSPQSLA